MSAVLVWSAPRRGGRLRDVVHRWTLDEAELLGLTGRGGLASYARSLLAGDESGATTRLGDLLPDPLDHVLVQPDLTVVAPGPLERDLARELALVADVESTGGATVYRVGEQSVRRALDAGRSTSDLHELFRTRSRTPVPQSLTYLVDDVARRHGRHARGRRQHLPPLRRRGAARRGARRQAHPAAAAAPARADRPREQLAARPGARAAARRRLRAGRGGAGRRPAAGPGRRAAHPAARSGRTGTPSRRCPPSRPPCP